MRFNKNIGIGADPLANVREYIEMATEDHHGLYIDQTTNPYTGIVTPSPGINVFREIRTPSGDRSLASMILDSGLYNYCGLKNTLAPRSISVTADGFFAHTFGDFEGSIADYGYMFAYGLDGMSSDDGKDLSSGNTRRWTYGANLATRNRVEVNKPSGAIELRAYGVNIDYVHLLPTLIAGTLTAKAFGLYANVLGNTLGDSVAYGVYTKVSGADKNYGYYSENPSLRLSPITAVPTDTPDEGTMRLFGPAGGPFRAYGFLDGAWRNLPSLITDAQHGTKTTIPDAHHPRLHAPDHSIGGADELPDGLISWNKLADDSKAMVMAGL